MCEYKMEKNTDNLEKGEINRRTLFISSQEQQTGS